MVVRQLNVDSLDSTDSVAAIAADMPIKSMTVNNGISKNHSKQQSNTTNSMPRKYVSMSPARVPRSKSMNGLSRIDANKINENGTTNYSTGYSHRSLKRSDVNSGGSIDNYSNGTDSSSSGWKTKRNNEYALLPFAYYLLTICFIYYSLYSLLSLVTTFIFYCFFFCYCRSVPFARSFSFVDGVCFQSNKKIMSVLNH